MTTILDIVDNYLTSVRADSVQRMRGVDLWKMHEVVHNYVSNYKLPKLDSRRFPIYLGGWPSANIHDADQSELLLSTLLYAGQVVAKDPICDWFSMERYRDPERPVSSRQGFLDWEGRPNVMGTRAFLANVVDALQRWRPLIESGDLVLVPGEWLLAQRAQAVDTLRAKILARVAADPEIVTRRFRPVEMAVDDRVRGLFVFTGGEREEQLRRAIDSSVRFFAREWLLADTVGAEYAAPWRYEHYLCERGLGTVLAENEHHRVINAVLRSQLPIFSGLSPKVVASIHDDDTFAEFRDKLFEVYRSIPNSVGDQDFNRVLGQTEETMLRPILQRAEKEAEHGFLYRAGARVLPTALSIGFQMLYAWRTHTFTPVDAGQIAVGEIADALPLKRSRDPLSAWTKLYRHQRKVSDDVQGFQALPGRPAESEPWHIDDEPSMNVRFMPGALLADDMPMDPAPAPTGYTDDSYRPCPCNSGLKWKFCCKGLGPRTP